MTQNNPVVLDLPPALQDVDAAAALIAEMRKFSSTDEIHLDAAGVTPISPIYLQILISAFKSFSRMSVAAASNEFNDAFAAYGLTYPQVLPQIHDDTPAGLDDLEPTPLAATASDPLLEAAVVPIQAEQTPAYSATPSPAAVSPPAVSNDGNQTDGVDMSNACAAKTILTIDDSRTMRDMLKMTLDGAGFTVLQAIDGQDGLNVLAQQPVDLIITDINMPKLDGYGVIRAVRSDPTYSATPILVLSTEAEQESKDIAKDAGATGWIVKPFDPDGLVRLVNAVCA